MEKSGYDTEAETGTTQSTDVDASQAPTSTDPDGGDDVDSATDKTQYAKVTSGAGGGGGGDKTTKAATTQAVQITKKEATKTKRPPTTPPMTPNITAAGATKAPKKDATPTKPTTPKKPPTPTAKPTAPKKPMIPTAKPTSKHTTPTNRTTTPKPTTPKAMATHKPATPKPATSKPATLKPATPKPTTPKPTTPKPTTPKPTTPKPTTPKPTTPKPTTPKPTTPKPTTPKPTTPKPTTPKPTTPKPTTKKPTTEKPTTIKTVAATTTVPPLLICTMLWKYPVMIFPPDGTCKHILLDSLYAYVGGAYNNIARSIHKSTKPFLDKGKVLKNTKLGYGVAHEAFEDFLTDIGTPAGANNFWTLVTPENANFALLDLNERALNDGELQRQLVNMKRLKEFVVQAKKVPMGILALALYGKSSEVCAYITKHMKDIIIPDVFLSFAHETIFDDSDDNCRILVPQFLQDPYTLSKQLPFGHSIGQAVDLLKCVSNAQLQMKLALFVTLNGRYYMAVKEKNVFDKCTMAGISEDVFYHKTTSRICSENFIKGSKPLLLADYETYKLENPKSKELYVVDSPDLLQRKLCKVKKDHTDIDYTLAVTKIMGIGEPIPCLPNIFDGDYLDLIFLRNLSGYIDGNFKSPSDLKECTRFY